MTNTELEAQTKLAIEEANKSNFDTAERLANEVLAELDKNLSHILSPEFTLNEEAAKNANSLSEKQHDATTLRAKAILALATLEAKRGNLELALEQAHRVLTLAQDDNLLSSKPKAWNIIGSVHQNLGNYDKALEYYGKALAAHNELGDKSGVARVTGNIGNVHHNLGNYDKVFEYLGKALAAHEELGEKSSVALVTGNIGIVHYNLGNYDKVLEYYGNALAVFDELGDKSGVATVMGNMGNVHLRLGNYDKALEYYGKALATHDEILNKPGVASVTGNIGTLYATPTFDGYDARKAEEYLIKAIWLSAEIGAKANLVDFHKNLSELYENEGRGMDALFQHKKYIELKDELNLQEVKKQESIREYNKTIELATSAAEAKLNTTTALLHRVLPESIATRMISGEEDIADYFPSVSILFADIAGFTPLSASMPAYIVVRFLNYVFGEFDKIIKKYGCEKIKTIGDGYMAVAGAPIECAEHAERIASAALAMQEAIKLPEEFREFLPVGKEFGIRIGVHTGAVVGGVIGDERFVYDIYSDAVNTAARMESHGEPDKIHVSHDYYVHLQNRFAMTKNKTHGLTFEKRGEMDIKGKGMMKTYFLEKATL